MKLTCNVAYEYKLVEIWWKIDIDWNNKQPHICTVLYFSIKNNIRLKNNKEYLIIIINVFKKYLY